MSKKSIDFSLYNFDKYLVFICLCLLTFLILFIKKTFIENETAAFQILEQRGEMGVFHLINGLQYFSIPIVYLFKFTIIAFVLWVGCFMFGYKVSYTQSWHVAMVSETIFLLPELIKVFWFIFISSDPNLFEIRAFYPLSLLQFFDYYNLHPRWHYVLKALNLFEVIYWFLLIQGIFYKSGKKYSVSRIIVFSSYVLFFFLWLGFYLLVYK